MIQIAAPDILSKLAKQENIMEALKPGTLCVIVGGCPENIGLVVEVLEHIGAEPPRADAYRIRTTSGRNFPQLKFGREEERLAPGTSNEAITDRHKLRPLVDASDDESASSASNSSPEVRQDKIPGTETAPADPAEIVAGISVAPFSTIPAEPLENPKGQYPYFVVRFMSCVYQRESIAVRIGEPSVHIGHKSSYIQHPAPYADDGSIRADCRKLLLNEVSAAVIRTKHRMCVVWKHGACSYVERDGRIDESDVTPSGGVALPAKIEFDKRVPLPIALANGIPSETAGGLDHDQSPS
ncbi:MAG: hypothetical protein U1E51_16340 [Candidatus Binatia bacterium]|nr:hypothetical protein [Candidatus Binatia bacterium]